MPNLIYIDKLANGDQAFKIRLINVIKDELPIEVQSYREFLKSNNLDFAAQSVHRIKHKIAILGYDDGYLIASNHENFLKLGKMDLVNDFEKVLFLIIEYITAL